MGNQPPEGYSIPLHKSITEPLLIAGVPSKFFFMNCTLGLGLSMMTRFYLFALVSFVLHCLMVYFTKQDPQYFEALKRHMSDEEYFDA